MIREFMAITCLAFLALAYVRHFRRALQQRKLAQLRKMAGWQ